MNGGPLLTTNEPGPVAIVNPAGAAPFLLIGDHAGNAVPQALGDLGVSSADRARHIGWDIGVRGLGERLAPALDAPFLHQHYSRLVIDCNRDPHRADAIPEKSDGTPIPGNLALSPADREARVAAIHDPYHAAVGAALRPETVLVSLHSFTPRLADGEPRPWQVGILHDRGDKRFSDACLTILRAEAGLTVGDNEPYRMDNTDHTVPRHAYPARRYVEFEVRQDLLADAAGQAEWAERLARVLTQALAATPAL